MLRRRVPRSPAAAPSTTNRGARVRGPVQWHRIDRAAPTFKGRNTMPLLDHFHAPLVDRYPWESFHATWAVALTGWLNRILPRRFLAVVQTHLGRRVEADVAEFERSA